MSLILNENGALKEYKLGEHEIPGLSLEDTGKGNFIIIGRGNKFVNTRIQFQVHRSLIIIGDENRFFNTLISLQCGENQYVSIGAKNDFFRMRYISRDDNKLMIGDRNLMAVDFIIIPTDFHSIIDLNTQRLLNYSAHVVRMGDHNWIGEDVTFLKSAAIGNDCIVGYRSVVTKAFGSNLVLGGNPARIIRTGCTWERETPLNYKRSHPV